MAGPVQIDGTRDFIGKLQFWLVKLQRIISVCPKAWGIGKLNNICDIYMSNQKLLQ